MSATTHLKERLNHDLKKSMRSKDQTRLLTVRSLISAITSREKEGGGPLSDDDLVAVVQKQAKQRRDSIKQYEEAGREDLAQRERDELILIQEYLPPQLTEDEIRRVVQDIVTRTGASTKQDMGRVMGEVMSELRGQADGNRVRGVVEQVLGGDSV